jgi:hypothetical protein
VLGDAIIFDDHQTKLGASMKNLFQPEAVDEVTSRIDALQPATQRLWGKMDVAQMMAHYSGALDMASGRLNPPRMFIGTLIGPLVKPIYSNDKPFSQNNPTDPQLVVVRPARLSARAGATQSQGLAISTGRRGAVQAASSSVLWCADAAGVGHRHVQAPGSSFATIWRVTCATKTWAA